VPKRTAITLHVEIEPDHTVRLPDHVPVGPAEVVVLIDHRPSEERTVEKAVLGLFADDAEIVDEALVYVRERRKNYRIGLA
jgi:hypothetical protein